MRQVVTAVAWTTSLAVLLLLAGCVAPQRQGAVSAPDAYGPPALEAEVFISFDGAELGMQSWLPDPGIWTEGPRAVIVGLHGMSDYSETFYLAGPFWASRGIAVYAYDQRGFGRSPMRGVWPERAVMMADIAYFVAAVRARHPGVEITLLGTSMGAAATLASLGSATPPDVDRVVLASPAVWGWSQMNAAYSLALRVAAGLAPGWSLTGESLGRWPSDNIEMLRKLGADPLMIRGTRMDALLGLVDLMDEGWRTRAGESVPALILMGENDEIVPPDVIRRYAAGNGEAACFKAYRHGYHMLLRDLQAQNVWVDIERFLDGECPPPEAEDEGSNEAAPSPDRGRSAR